MTLPLVDQIVCVRRELRLRQTTYPDEVRRGRMTQAWADYQLAAMTEVLRTLGAVYDAQEAGDRTPLFGPQEDA